MVKEKLLIKGQYSLQVYHSGGGCRDGPSEGKWLFSLICSLTLKISWDRTSESWTLKIITLPYIGFGKSLIISCYMKILSVKWGLQTGVGEVCAILTATAASGTAVPPCPECCLFRRRGRLWTSVRQFLRPSLLPGGQGYVVCLARSLLTGLFCNFSYLHSGAADF